MSSNFSIWLKRCVNLKCIGTLPAEDMVTPSLVATDSRLFSPNIGNTTSSPRGTSAIYRLLQYEKSTKAPEILPCKYHSYVALGKPMLE